MSSETIAHKPFVNLGGGTAAGYAAGEFAERGQGEHVLILSAENRFLLHRPPLSKDALAAEMRIEDARVTDPELYAQHGIRVELNTPIISSDLREKRLEDGDGRLFGYDQLLIAAGKRLDPRALRDEARELTRLAA